MVTKQLTENKSCIQHNKKENKEENKSSFQVSMFVTRRRLFTGSSTSLEKRKWDKIAGNNGC